MKKYPKKRIAITGSGSGLGKTLAIDFAKLGWKVAVSDMIQSRIDETVDAVNEAGGEGIGVLCDVSKPEHVESLADEVLSKWDGADIIVNNAGVPASGYIEEIPIEDWKWIIDTNLMGVIHGCRTFLPIFKKQGAGHIVNVASAAGIASLAEMSPYNVTKAGVISLTETLRVELAGQNIGVTAVAPTFFKTNLMDQARYQRDLQRKRAEAFFEKSYCDVNHVSRKVIKGIKKNQLYVLPQFDARFFWRFKRLAPQKFFGFMGMFYSKGWLDKFLGI
jgi:NAD(P)-dependent dehydrogenase (short-subunit alcohol dehydrogenase family)